MAQQYAPLSPSPLSRVVRNASDTSFSSTATDSTAPASPVASSAAPTETPGEANEVVHQDGSAQFAANRDRLLQGLAKSTDIVNDLKEFNYGRWIVHYPDINPPSYHNLPSPSSSSSLSRLGEERASSSSSSGSSTADFDSAHSSAESSSAATSVAARPAAPARANTLAHAPASAPSTPQQPQRARPVRSSTSRDINEDAAEGDAAGNAADAESESNELSILRLDFRVGPHRTALASNGLTQGGGGFSLEKSSVAQLLDGRMTQAVRHLEALRMRISDKQSKVLVTGDLNAGKSTFVNALLRKEVMPTDQQPCTTVFAEVLDAEQENAGKEEIHVVRSGRIYRQEDGESYVSYDLNDSDKLLEIMDAHTPEAADESSASTAPDSAAGALPLVKVFCKDRRATQESLLRNGVVDIALIDAPGLNRDSLKTTALFARQEEIDVIVFVVSAENHFTLSAKEFLWNASNEKAYIFIVVNKFDQIKNKDKCRRLVLEQIRQLSPRTYEDAEELVHFVDSSAISLELEQVAENLAAAPEQDATTVETVETDDQPSTPPNGEESPAKKLAGESLSGLPSTPGSFFSQSSPASNGSIDLRSASEKDLASRAAFARLEASLRDFVLLKRSKSKLMPAQTYILHLLSDVAFLARHNAAVARAELQEAKEMLEESRPALADYKKRHEKLNIALEEEEDLTVVKSARVAKEHLEKALKTVGNGVSPHPSVALPAYPGLFDVFQYAEDVRTALLEGLEAAVKDAEEGARQATTASVALVKAMGEAELPPEVEPSKRSFMPEAMFSTKRHRISSKLYGPSAGLGISSQFAWLGLGIDAASVRPTDIVDVPHYLQAVFPAFLAKYGHGPQAKSGKKSLIPFSDDEQSLANSLTLGLGALTLVGGKALGAKAALEGVLRVFDLIGNKTARKWAGPVLAVSVAGAVVYIIMDLPNSIPRNVGRSIEAAGVRPPSPAVAAAAAGASAIVDESESQEGSETAAFTAIHTQRISREVRKVMRLAAWDLQELFRNAITVRNNQVIDAEAQEKLASEAVAYFEKTGQLAKDVRDEVEHIRILDDVVAASSAPASATVSPQ